MQTSADSANPLVERLKAIQAGITPERQAEIDQELAIERDLANRKEIVSVGMPSIFERVPFEVAPKRARDWARKCWKGDSRNLVLIGDSGEGKTEAACALLAGDGPARPVPIRHFRRHPARGARHLRRGRHRGGRDGQMGGCAVLCLDDLGKERPTQDVLDKLFALIDHRYRARPRDHLHDAVQDAQRPRKAAHVARRGRGDRRGDSAARVRNGSLQRPRS